MKKKHLILIIISIFVVSVAVRYYPVFYRGYSYSISADNLILARNLSFANKYSLEDEKNVVLSSSLIAEKGMSSGALNKLTSVIYGKIFNIFGFNPDTPLYVSLFFYALTTVLLFLLILKLFNLKIALIFAGVDIFMPFVLAGAIWFGFYEWAMLFFIIAILIYLWKEKPNAWRLLLSGLFFGLAALARNAFLISFIPFVVYDWYVNFIYKKDWRRFRLWLWPTAKRIFVFILPVILLWGGMMLSDYSRGISSYYLTKGDIGYDGHLFRDPYTYHFEKDSYIEEIKNTADGETIGYLKKYGYDINWKQYLTIYFYSTKYYLNNFFRQPTLGGPLIIFFLILGAIYLFKNRRSLLTLSVLWVGILFFILIYLGTSNWDHFLEIRFPLVLLISSGIFWSLKWLSQAIQNKKTYFLLSGAILLTIFFHFIQSDKWMFHENYLYSRAEEKVNLVELIKKSNIDIDVNDVIAISKDPLFLNYYTDHNYIYFSPETIEKLLKENKLKWAFDQFGVTYILGFDNLSWDIIDPTGVKIIDSTIK
jgi:hypothetical protein